MELGAPTGAGWEGWEGEADPSFPWHGRGMLVGTLLPPSCERGRAGGELVQTPMCDVMPPFLDSSFTHSFSVCLYEGGHVFHLRCLCSGRAKPCSGFLWNKAVWLSPDSGASKQKYSGF